MLIKKQKEIILTSVITLIESSELKYKSGDFKGAIDDRIEAKRMSKKIGEGVGFKDLIIKARINKSRYNLIEDYKRKIDDIKKIELIKQLEKLSENKYNLGDYKGAIRAFRRAEKYY